MYFAKYKRQKFSLKDKKCVPNVQKICDSKELLTFEKYFVKNVQLKKYFVFQKMNKDVHQILSSKILVIKLNIFRLLFHIIKKLFND
jgi:hypothetical protein